MVFESTNGTEGSANDRIYERKDENFMTVCRNAGGIMITVSCWETNVCYVLLFSFMLCALFYALCFVAEGSQGELMYTSRAGVSPSVRVSVRPSVNTFKHEYLRNQWANCNQILSEASFGWGKGCLMFLARSDWNSGFHGNG